MGEIPDRYSRLAGAFAAKIAAVPADRWSDPSPCEGWSALDVVRHVVSTQGMFLGLVGRQMGDLPSVDDDPAAAWAAASDTIRADLGDPALAGATFEGTFGTMTFEQAVDRFLNFDLVVHGWDLARAAGLDDRIDPEDVERVRGQAEAMGERLRSPRAFGPETVPPAGAGPQERLLAYLGRRA